MKNPWRIEDADGVSIYSLGIYTIETGMRSGNAGRVIRWRWQDKKNNLIDVEVWRINNVKRRGVLGIAISKRLARYTMLKVKDTYYLHGKAESWYWNGQRRQVLEYNAKDLIKDEFDSTSPRALYMTKFLENGKLQHYFDAKKYGTDKPREARFDYQAGKQVLVLWRGKYCIREFNCSFSGDKKITRAANGGALDDCTDSIRRTYNKDGSLIEEQGLRNNRLHGFSREFSKSGRVLDEKLFIRGFNVPHWVYLDPDNITPEEIQSEEDEDLRAIMLELQGAERYRLRVMARGPIAVARTRPPKESTEITERIQALLQQPR